jgi:rfaE bifunctional protein nucleotidyltransferase chain/domain
MAKIVERAEDLAGVIRGLQSQGKVVVFTNGVFDLLHVGHLRALKDAKSRGDFLVVGVNTDDSVKRFKDPNLPVNPLAERLEVLESLSMIDYLTPISDPTADNLLKVLRPDLHAKGTDYTEETVPERATVLAYGGRTIIVGDAKAHSTTDLIRKIQGMVPRKAGNSSSSGSSASAKPQPKASVSKPSASRPSPSKVQSKNVYAGKARVRIKVAPAKAAPRRPAKPLHRKLVARKR